MRKHKNTFFFYFCFFGFFANNKRYNAIFDCFYKKIAQAFYITCESSFLYYNSQVKTSTLFRNRNVEISEI